MATCIATTEPGWEGCEQQGECVFSYCDTEGFDECEPPGFFAATGLRIDLGGPEKATPVYKDDVTYFLAHCDGHAIALRYAPERRISIRKESASIVI
jgi:hypothetical protein